MSKFYAKTRIVEALEIKAIESAGGFVVVSLDDGSNETLSSDMVARYMPNIGDYLVTNDDGYQYVNPKMVFEDHYANIKDASPEAIEPEDLQDLVATAKYAIDGTLTIAIAILWSGFRVTGYSNCMMQKEYDKELGEGIALKNATEKLWELEGYRRLQFEDEIKSACIAFDEKKNEMSNK